MSLAPDPVLLDVSPEGVAVVRINRAERGDTLDELTVQALADAFETLKGADHVRIVFIRGAGGNFCAGMDREWLERQGARLREDNDADLLSLARMLKALHDLRQFTVALIEGPAFGPGLGLIAACDAAIAKTNAQFAAPEGRLGLIAAASAPFLVEAVGARQAKALMATGEEFDAAFAEKIGLISRVVEDEAALEAEAERLAKLAFTVAPGAADASKALVRHIAAHPLNDAALREAAHRGASRIASTEGVEGLAALKDGRKPGWET